MPLIPTRRGPGKWRAASRFVAVLLLFLSVLGLMSDLLFGLPLSFSARSWTTWLVGLVALGVLYLFGEGGGEWINERDRVTHPLWKRVWHLALLLGLAVGISAAAAAVVRMAQ
jgi:hypothetical protein